MNTRTVLPLTLFLCIQALCTLMFVSDIAISVLDLPVPPMRWETHEMIEIAAIVGLTIGMVLGWLALRRAMRDAREMQAHLRRAQGAFHDLMAERFVEWGLTPAERDVALFAIKGLNTAEIAAVRGTSEGTIKSQSNAIYRKAGVGGRAQLLGLLIDDLTGDTPVPVPAPEPVRAAG